MNTLHRPVAELSELPAGAWFTPQEAADYIRISKIALAVRRSKGQGNIKYSKRGNLVRYRKRDLDEHLEGSAVAWSNTHKKPSN